MNNTINSNITTENNIILGQNIRKIRKGLKMTQEEFSEKINMNCQYLSRVENGKAGITIDTVINICKLANCSSVQIFKNVIKSPNTNDNYDLLNERDKSIIDQMIIYLLNTK